MRYNNKHEKKTMMMEKKFTLHLVATEEAKWMNDTLE